LNDSVKFVYIDDVYPLLFEDIIKKMSNVLKIVL